MLERRSCGEESQYLLRGGERSEKSVGRERRLKTAEKDDAHECGLLARPSGGGEGAGSLMASAMTQWEHV